MKRCPDCEGPLVQQASVRDLWYCRDCDEVMGGEDAYDSLFDAIYRSPKKQPESQTTFLEESYPFPP